VGESVLVEESSGKVFRVNPPSCLTGEVISFDHSKGYGFLSAEGISYFLHLSEVEATWVPLVGSKARFYVAQVAEGQRACYVEPAS